MPTSSRTSRRWYRSLYWRMVIGLVAAVAATIAVQGLVVLSLLGRDGPAPGPPPRGFTRLVARDIASALAETPTLDVERFVREEYQRRLFPFVVVLQDGRVIGLEGASLASGLIDRAKAQLAKPGQDRPDAFPFVRGPGALRDGGRERAGRGLGLGRAGAELGSPPPAFIRVDGRNVGVVLAVPQTAARRFGPMLALTGTAALLLATVLVTAAVIGPVRSRLSNLEHTSRSIGQGNLAVTAREDGGDEVADLARSFNHMARELKARQEEVVATDRARRLLLADVSHELMTPLTSMRGYLETLAIPALAMDHATRERYLGIISDETRRLQAIVGDLLDLSRLEAGGSRLDIEDVSVEALFGAVVARHTLQATSRGIILGSGIDVGAEIVRGDARRLEQALQNLVANALRHTPPGGGITLRCQLDGPNVVISVRDTGAGIPPEHLPRVFDRFYKVDASRGGGSEGSGLGLSIVKAIVDRHGGAVTVTSAGGGTTFQLRLPTGDGS